MATLVAIILAAMGVQPLDVFAGACTFTHVVGAVVRAWLCEGWKVISTLKQNSEPPPPCSCKLVFLSGVDPPVTVWRACMSCAVHAATASLHTDGWGGSITGD